METLLQLPESFPQLYEVSDSIKVVEVARKYNTADGSSWQGSPIMRVPEYTIPGSSHSYHCSKNETAWTQGFFPGLLWLMVERRRLLPDAVEPSYSENAIIELARRYQDGFKWMARPAENHDQGFRFQLCYGQDLLLTENKIAREVLIDAADSLVDRYSPEVGCIRSWDSEKPEEHYLVIIDNMMNLDLLYLATELTGDAKYADIANHQAFKSLTSHVRPNWTTYHVVDFHQDGSIQKCMTAQGYSDESTWSRGQAWGIYGYAQCALRTGKSDFLSVSRKLGDKFLELLPESGVPWWDFDAPKPCPYDASAATIAACGLLMLYKLLHTTEVEAAQHYLSSSFKLVRDTLRECKTGKATLNDGKVNWGEGDWETILEHSTMNGNRNSPKIFMDHGLVYADFYLVQFGNEALKLKVLAK